MSSKVPSRENILNNIDITKRQNGFENQEQNNSTINPFWEEVLKEFVELTNILKSNNDESG